MSSLTPGNNRMLIAGFAVLFGYLVITLMTTAQTSRPAIIFTQLPPFGSFENLRGRVVNVNPADFRVMVFIRVGGVLWSKPTCAKLLVPIQATNEFEVDITTGGVDEQAVEIIGLIVRPGFRPRCVLGRRDMPAEVSAAAVARISVTRTDTRERTVSFSGYEWAVKRSAIPVQPGPCRFSDAMEAVWVDELGRLHLKIGQQSGQWFCSEVISKSNFGYGKYVFEFDNPPPIDPAIACGLFTWDTNNDPRYGHREIDIECGKFAFGGPDNFQYVVQPWRNAANILRFEHPSRPNSVHIFEWRADRIIFQSWAGGNLVKEWTHFRSLPAATENARMNLWLFQGRNPARETELIIKRFQFVPLSNLLGSSRRSQTS